MKKYRNHGFTLIELMITVGIVAVTMTIAVPSMNEFIKNESLTTQSNALIGHLQFARSEAMSTHKQVVVCPSSDAATCSGSNSWENGWIVFSDDDTSGTVTDGDTILKGNGKLKNKVKISNSGNAAVIYDRRGFAPNSESVFSVCDDRGASKGKSTTIGKTGRLRKGGNVSC